MKKKRSGLIRILSLLLVLTVLANLPVSALAAVSNEDLGLEPYSYNYDSKRAQMIDHSAFRALRYLGYDRYNNLGNAGELFVKIRGDVPAADRTSITYSESTGTKGRETANINVGYFNVVLLHCRIVALLHCRIVVLSHCYVVALLRCRIVTLLRCLQFQ